MTLKIRALRGPMSLQAGNELIAWFLRRYPTGAARLDKARRSYEQWARSIPREVLEAEERARRDEALAPGVFLELE